MKPEERRQMWQERIDACESSGLSIAEWCRRNEINASAFYQWRKRLSEVTPVSPNPDRWMQVNVRNETPVSHAPIVIRLGDATIEVSTGVNPGLLREVVRVLGGE